MGTSRGHSLHFLGCNLVKKSNCYALVNKEQQAKLLIKSRERSIEQRRNVELLSLKYQIEEYLQSMSGSKNVV